MALQPKPDISQIWASGGSLVEPNDTKKQTGWTAEVPPFQWENWIQNRQDQFLAHINQRGIPAWDGLTEYEAGGLSYVQGTNGVVYKSVLASGPSTTVQDPTTDVGEVYWIKAFAEAGTGQNIAVFATAGVTNWTVPDELKNGERKAEVFVTGGGGSGSRRSADAGNGGGAGVTRIGFVDLTGETTVPVTVGAGGAAVSVNGPGNNGSASSFGSFISSPGGIGAAEQGGGIESTGGAGGDIVISGGGGATACNTPVGVASGMGGASYWGGGGRGAFTVGGSAGRTGAPGSGGSGSQFSTNSGPGTTGIVVVRW